MFLIRVYTKSMGWDGKGREGKGRDGKGREGKGREGRGPKNTKSILVREGKVIC